MKERLFSLKSFTVALSFLTILRMPFYSVASVTPDELARSFAFYPLVGGILGICYVLLACGLTPVVPPLLLAAIVTVCTVIMTRALHLDGLADLADGIGGGYTPERRLEIMKDSRTGAFGALALALAVALKVVAIYYLILEQFWSAVFLAPAFSRFGMVFLAHQSPYARKEGGLGKPFLESMTSRDVLLALLFLLALSVLVSLKLTIVYAIGTLCTVQSLKVLSRRCLGGITGDVLGATNEITEIVLLAISACLR